MAERWFVLPGWRGQGARSSTVGVKYIDLDIWTGTPQISGVARRQWRFDLIDNRVVLIKARAETDAPLDQLAAQPDVFEIVDLNATIGGPAYNRLRNFLRSSGLPTDWLVRDVTTYGEAIDEFIELCTLTNRFHLTHKRSLTLTHADTDDPVTAQDLLDCGIVAQSLGITENPAIAGITTHGQLLEWGRTRARIPTEKRRN